MKREFTTYWNTPYREPQMFYVRTKDGQHFTATARNSADPPYILGTHAAATPFVF